MCSECNFAQLTAEQHTGKRGVGRREAGLCLQESWSLAATLTLQPVQSTQRGEAEASEEKPLGNAGAVSEGDTLRAPISE